MGPKKRKSIVKARGWSVSSGGDQKATNDAPQPSARNRTTSLDTSSDMSISSDEGCDPLSPSKKRQKHSSPAKTGPQKSPQKSPQKKKMTYAQATTRTLSKFSQNLLKPGYLASRAKLIVEAPEIPLNDEFLQAFGRSVTSTSGLPTSSAPSADASDASDSDSDSDSDAHAPSAPKLPQTPKEKTVRVRVSNLNFQTTSETLERHFGKFGAVSNLQLLPSQIPHQQNSGRAYLTLERYDETFSVKVPEEGSGHACGCII